MKTYDPSLVTISLGTLAVQNWNSVAVALEEDEWNFKSGTQGEVTRIKNLNKLGSFTVALDNTSADNNSLSTLQKLGALVACRINDKSGNTVATIPEGTIIKLPDIELGKESGEVSWMVKGKIEEYTVGGN